MVIAITGQPVNKGLNVLHPLNKIDIHIIKMCIFILRDTGISDRQTCID